MSEQDHHGSSGPLSYAPRYVRERPDARPVPQETQSEAGRAIEPRGFRAVPSDGFDTQLEKAVSEALRHPLDPEVIQEPAGLTRELRRMAVLGVAGRFAAAVGVSALVALFFVVMIPAARQPDGLSSSTAGMINSIKAALPQQQPPQTQAQTQPQPRQQEDSPKSAISEFQSILATAPSPSTSTSTSTSTQPVTREQSEKLLQQFVQWRQKPAPNQAP
jgi:hypothetical protein